MKKVTKKDIMLDVLSHDEGFKEGREEGYEDGVLSALAEMEKNE